MNNKITGYSNMPLKSFYKIREIIESDMEDIDIQANLIAIINDMDIEDVYNLPISKYEDLVDSISFLMEVPKPSNLRLRQFVINGHKYKLIDDVEKMTTGQYIDYQSYLKNEMGYEYIITCFLIPEGKKYGEYNVGDVIKDVMELDIQSCLNVCFFFQKKWLKSIKDSLIYSDLMILRSMRKAPKEKRMELKTVRKQIHQKISEINGIGNTWLI